MLEGTIVDGHEKHTPLITVLLIPLICFLGVWAS